jgi:hypothetical protein
MHPKFQINKEEISGRQSPYPTIVMEVSSQPEEELVLPSHSDSTKNVVKSLESLFEKSAVLHKKTDGNKSNNDSESAFWDNIGKVRTFVYMYIYISTYYHSIFDANIFLFRLMELRRYYLKI